LPVYSYIGYAPDALNFSGGISIAPGYDENTDRVEITVTDDAGGTILGGLPDDGLIFDGDRFSNENGDDATQTGVVTELDGTVVASGAIYLEERYSLTAAGQSPVTVYRVEVEGLLVGYVSSAPLVAGVTYGFSTSNVVPANAPDTSDPDAIVDVPCFLAGTRIATPDGPRRVEDLQPGDKVRCADGSLDSVIWSGQKTVLPGFMETHGLWPICIPANTLGPNTPSRDLRVSPNHRMQLANDLCAILFGEAEVLVPAKFMLGFDGVYEDRAPAQITYCHILFATHRVVLAEGAPSESLHRGGQALGAMYGDARDEVLRLFPELDAKGVEGYGAPAAPVLRRAEAAVLLAAMAA